MSESRRLGQKWTEPELIVVLDMYFNGHLTDSHGHDEIAKCLGRYNPNTNSYSDGAVNEKLAEIKGYVEGSRAHRHPGNTIISLIGKHERDHTSLRARAITAWREILRDYRLKRKRYKHDSMFKSARDLAKRCESWTPHSIAKRSTMLGGWVVSRWKY
jgi:hypothetical protein